MYESYKILNTVSFVSRLILYYFMNYDPIISNKTIENVTLKYDLSIIPCMLCMNVVENVVNFLLLIFVVVQFYESNHFSFNTYLTELESKFIILNVCNAFSLITFVMGENVTILISVFCLLFELSILFVMMRQCNFFNKSKKWYEKLYGDFPLSIYFGWTLIYFFIKLMICIRFYTDYDNKDIIFLCILFVIGAINSLILFYMKNYYTILVYFYYSVLYIVRNKSETIGLYGGICCISLYLMLYITYFVIKFKREKEEKMNNDEYERMKEVI